MGAKRGATCHNLRVPTARPVWLMPPDGARTLCTRSAGRTRSVAQHLPLLSVLIVTYNAEKVLAACLDSLAENPPSCEYEVLCVDNGSTDGTRGILEDRRHQVLVIDNDRNLGFAGGNVLAAEHAQGELLFLLNPDTVVLPGAIDTLVGELLADETRHVAGACLLTAEGEPGTTWGDFPTIGWALANTAPWNRLGLRIRSRVRMGHTCEGFTGVTSVGWVSGAAFLIRRRVWDALGGLDTGYFLYYEETDLCFRVHAAGGDVVVVPQARIVHMEGAVVGSLSARQYAWSTESLIRFLRRNRGLLAALVVRGWVVGVNCLLWLLSFVGGERMRAERDRYAGLIRVGLGLARGLAAGGTR
jgi:N-acetylglucosaminyl-diphospho-decaprenol L-rhamnosyltransferase